MPDIRVKVEVETSGLDHLIDDIGEGLGSASGPFGPTFIQWAAIYRADMRERFDNYSKGGGDWKPLAPSTVASRRDAAPGSVGPRVVSILRDTSTLFNTLDFQFGRPGQIQQLIPRGINVGIGGASQHPGGPATIGEIAAFHHFGQGVPKREIMVQPSDRAAAKMAEVMEDRLNQLIERNGG